MRINELLEKNLVLKIEENKFECCQCGKQLTKLGITNHYFYCHEESGKEVKERLRTIATIQNNTEEMRKKISDGTKKAYENPELREKVKRTLNSEETKRKMSINNINQWKDPELRKKRTESIKRSRTDEYKKNMSEKLKEVFNRPDSKMKSEDFRKRMSEKTLKEWKDPIQRQKKINAAKNAWKDNNSRKLNMSIRVTNLWKDPNHIEKVIDGKIRTLKKIKKSLGICEVTSKGNFYESTFERDVFEFLENNNILFKPHVTIPTSSKICDLVINNIWIELDGLGRARFDFTSKYSWGNKIGIYETLKKDKIINDFKIFTSREDFIEWTKESLTSNIEQFKKEQN